MATIDHWPPRVADRVAMVTKYGAFYGTVMESEEGGGMVKFDDPQPPWDKLDAVGETYNWVIVGHVGEDL